MRICFSLSAVILGLMCLLHAQPVRAALAGNTTRVATGLSSPLFATFAPGDNSHLFVLEKGGNIKVVDLNSKTVLPTTFLNIPDTDAADEGGLVGLAFNPNYNSPGKAGYGQFYVYVTVDNGGLQVPGGTAASATSPFSTHIRQYSVSSNPYVASTTPTEIMSWARPQDNHVGGWIGFGPKDGYLYIDSGDGGSSNDSAPGHFEPGGNAQNITNDFMGKQLRIDVSGDAFPADASKNYAIPPTNPFVGITGDDEIWSYGLRNPYRASFDRDTGDMWIGDVGQDTREEIDVEHPGRTHVSNYGWRLREGSIQTPTGGVGGAAPANYVAPVYDYTHGSGSLQGNAVIGGYVYRGPDPSLQGTYFFADEVSGHVWSMNTSTFAVTNIDNMITPLPNNGTISGPASFAEDSVGNIYIVAYNSGGVFKINTTQLLTGDYNADGTVNAADYIVWRKSFGSTTNLAADGNHNNMIDNGDYTVWQNNFGTTVHTTGLGAGTTIPEPAVVAIVMQGALIAAGWRRRR
jgi:glucose/arabinose dehydrogenase